MAVTKPSANCVTWQTHLVTPTRFTEKMRYAAGQRCIYAGFVARKRCRGCACTHSATIVRSGFFRPTSGCRATSSLNIILLLIVLVVYTGYRELRNRSTFVRQNKIYRFASQKPTTHRRHFDSATQEQPQTRSRMIEE